MTVEKPLRIGQVVGGMNRAGTETWLMHVLRHIDRTQFQIDFLVHTTEPGAYDEEIRDLGCRIIPCQRPNQPWIYTRNFKRVLRDYGPYDIVHSHVQHYSGYVLRLAHQMGVPIRIAHSHNDTSREKQQANLLRGLYLRLMEAQIAHYATDGLAVSHQAAAALFHGQWAANPHYRVLTLGLDFTPFGDPVDRAGIRRELGIPEGAFVIGHVGRLAPQKNHRLLVQIAAEVLKCEPQMHLLLLGAGPLRPNIEQQVVDAGLGDHVTFAGVRSDVPRIMMGAMDVFVMPSLCEGLGLVAVEAQAAGLPCVISDVIPAEADVVGPLVQRLSLSQSAATWADAILATRCNSDRMPSLEALRLVNQSAFNIQNSVGKLTDFYTDSGPTSRCKSPVNEETAVRSLLC